jgi:hypothetical protein
VPRQSLGDQVYNPSYSGGSAQENHSLNPTWANGLQDIVLKKPNTQITATGVIHVGPEFKPQYRKKKVCAMHYVLWLSTLRGKAGNSNYLYM